MHRILIIDDDTYFLESLKNLLVYKKYAVKTCANPVAVLDILKKTDFELILLDVKMPGMDGLEVLEQIRVHDPQIPVIMVSGQSSISNAVQAIKQGAFDFVEKPVDSERLLLTVSHALDRYALREERQKLIRQLRSNYQMVGESPSLHAIFRQIEQVAQTNAKVLVTGETGTGKELVARAIHFTSARASGPFIKINCAAIPAELMESELFGHTKGAYTGATKEYGGKFRAADGGTLFLDEIGDMDLMLQAKLLHVLQDNAFMMLGSNDTVNVDVRIIAATNQNLKQLIRDGKFREDLYHRINVFPIHIPPLRERKEDIPLLVHHFLEEFAQTYNRKIREIPENVIRRLIRHTWPGNVRELKHLIEKLIITKQDEQVSLNDILWLLEGEEKPVKKIPANVSLKQAIRQHERSLIIEALEEHNWERQKTAEALHIDRSALFKKMRKLEIRKPD